MKTLNDFVDGPEATLAVVKTRYGSGFIAFVANEEYISEMCSALTGGDEESANIRYGIFETDWYPVGFGQCVEEAIIDLNIRVSAFTSDEGMIELYNKAYGIVTNNIFSYDSDLTRYVFNNELTQNNFPTWLRKYITLDENKLYALMKQSKGIFDA